MTNAFIVTAPGKVELRAVQEDSNGRPRQTMLFYRFLPQKFIPEEENKSSLSETLTGITVLRHHILTHVSGIEYHAYWPENWLDQWGADEVGKFIAKEPNVGPPPPREQDSRSTRPSDQAHSEITLRMEHLYGSMVSKPLPSSSLGDAGV